MFLGPRHALPYIGSQTLRVREFALVPVLVVPVRLTVIG